MKVITINGKLYALTDDVPWDDAIADGGFYYDRARFLGLPEPQAILFDESAPGYLDAMARYHRKFADAEADAIARVVHTWD